MSSSKNELLQAITEKYERLGENPETYLKGLLQAKPITYWDYIEVDTLLSLQKPRTHFKDEAIFIMYHQITELLLKMIRHEIEQLYETESIEEAVWTDKLSRCIRYTTMLITSFDIMKDGMSYDDYNTFRSTLTPASGFQSAQFRYIELYCTPLRNLVNEAGKQELPNNPSVEDYFEVIYWRDAGYNRKTGQKTLTMRQFEEKYLDAFIALARKTQGNTLAERFEALQNPSKQLETLLHQFDVHYNVDWPNVHLNTAKHYLESNTGSKTATGGSEWKKYLDPKHQQRKFFPQLWPS
jgi:tryptophan 2,3-dioxygenase